MPSLICLVVDLQGVANIKRLPIFLIIMIANLMILAGIAQAVLPEPILFYTANRLNQTGIHDDSDSTNDGALAGYTFSNGVVDGATLAAGKYGQGYSFDGTGGNVTIPYTAALNLSELTFSMWVYFAGPVRNSNTGCMRPSNYAYVFSCFNTSTATRFGWGITNSTTGLSTIYSATNQPYGVWHHLVGTVNSTHYSFYYDGVLQGSNAYVGGLLQTSKTIFIGQDPADKVNRNFNGTIDEVRIWSRALSAAEIANEYANGTKPTTSHGLVASYPFEGNAIDYNEQVLGHSQGAIAFDPDRATKITVPNAAQFNTTDSFTISAWAKVLDTNCNGECYIFIKGSGAALSDGMFSLSYYPTGTTFAARNSTGGTTQITKSMALSGWHFVLASYNNATGNVSLYVDGSLQSSSIMVGGLQRNTKPILIGYRDTWNYYFNGTIDDARIYNVSLTAAEVLELYNQYASYVTIDKPTPMQGFLANAIPPAENLSIAINYTLGYAEGELALDTCSYKILYSSGSSATFAGCSNESTVIVEPSLLGHVKFNVTVNDTLDNRYTANTTFMTGAITSSLADNQTYNSQFLVNVTSYFGDVTNQNCTVATNKSCSVELMGSCIIPFLVCNNSIGGPTRQISCLPITDSSEGHVQIWVSCKADGVEFNTTHKEIWIDAVGPIFVNNTFNGENTSFWQRNLTGFFNIYDPGLYKVRFEVDGQDFYELVGINTSWWNYTLNKETDGLVDVMPLGRHTFTAKAWDSHTANEIPEYDVSTPALSNAITFDTGSNKIKIKGEGFEIANPWKTAKEKDRYTFDYSSDTKKQKVVFEVETDQEIYIINRPDSIWKTWIVSGDNWIDFWQPEDPLEAPKITKTGKTTALVEISTKGKEVLKFSSVGELNMRSYNYTFYTHNLTLTYATEVGEGELQSITLQADYNGTGLPYSTALKYNGTVWNYTTTDFTNYRIMNATFFTPQPNASSAVIMQNVWNYTFMGENATINFNQTIMRSAIDGCVVNTVPAMRLYYFDEDSPTTSRNATSQLEITYWITNKSAQKIAYINFGTANSTHTVCLSNASLEFGIDLYIQQTVAGGYTHRYYIYDGYLNSTAQNLTLYNFNTTTGISDLRLTTRDYDTNLFYSNVVAKLQRLYLGEGVWRTVQMDRSGDYGLMTFHVKEQSTDYRIVYSDTSNNILKTTDSMKFACSSDYNVCELTQLLSPYSASTSSNLISIAWEYIPASNSVNMTWSDPLGGSNTMETTLVKHTYTGTTTLCNSSQTGSAGFVNCPTSGYTGEAFFTIYANGELVVSEWVDLNTTKLGDSFDDKEGAWWAGIIVLTCAMFGLLSPAVAIICMIIGLIAVFMLGIFTPLTMTLIVVATIVGIAIGWKVRN